VNILSGALRTPGLAKSLDLVGGFCRLGLLVASGFLMIPETIPAVKCLIPDYYGWSIPWVVLSTAGVVILAALAGGSLLAGGIGQTILGFAAIRSCAI
jgi:hypothetical protein